MLCLCSMLVSYSSWKSLTNYVSCHGMFDPLFRRIQFLSVLVVTLGLLDTCTAGIVS